MPRPAPLRAAWGCSFASPRWAENAGVFSGRLALRDPLCWTAHFTGRGEPGAHLNSNLPMNSRSTLRWEFVSWGWSRADMTSPRLGPGDTAPPSQPQNPTLTVIADVVSWNRDYWSCGGALSQDNCVLITRRHLVTWKLPVLSFKNNAHFAFLLMTICFFS